MAVSFTMEIEDSTRQEVVIGLVLMTFLFKLSALSPSMLPPISYTTMLDRFLLLNSTMVWFIMLWTGVIMLVHRISKLKMQEDILDSNSTKGESEPADTRASCEWFRSTVNILRWLDPSMAAFLALLWLLVCVNACIMASTRDRKTNFDRFDLDEKNAVCEQGFQKIHARASNELLKGVKAIGSGIGNLAEERPETELALDEPQKRRFPRAMPPSAAPTEPPGSTPAAAPTTASSQEQTESPESAPVPAPAPASAPAMVDDAV